MPQQALSSELAEMFAGRPLEHWLELIGPADCCFEAVASFEELPAHPQVAARDQIVRHDGAEPLVEALLGLRLDGAPPPRRAPLVELEPEAAAALWRLD
jgi:crotonobetainyl-CoA:carnitine CoA-transferase CaiB-like acyl-CoA transferase